MIVLKQNFIKKNVHSYRLIFKKSQMRQSPMHDNRIYRQEMSFKYFKIKLIALIGLHTHQH